MLLRATARAHSRAVCAAALASSSAWHPRGEHHHRRNALGSGMGIGAARHCRIAATLLACPRARLARCIARLSQHALSRCHSRVWRHPLRARRASGNSAPQARLQQRYALRARAGTPRSSSARACAALIARNIIFALSMRAHLFFAHASLRASRSPPSTRTPSLRSWRILPRILALYAARAHCGRAPHDRSSGARITRLRTLLVRAAFAHAALSNAYSCFSARIIAALVAPRAAHAYAHTTHSSRARARASRAACATCPPRRSSARLALLMLRRALALPLARCRTFAPRAGLRKLHIFALRGGGMGNIASNKQQRVAAALAARCRALKHARKRDPRRCGRHPRNNMRLVWTCACALRGVAWRHRDAPYVWPRSNACHQRGCLQQRAARCRAASRLRGAAYRWTRISTRLIAAGWLHRYPSRSRLIGNVAAAWLPRLRGELRGRCAVSTL